MVYHESSPATEFENLFLFLQSCWCTRHDFVIKHRNCVKSKQHVAFETCDINEISFLKRIISRIIIQEHDYYKNKDFKYRQY